MRPSAPLDLAHYLRIQAHANRLANHRLHGALAQLSTDELLAPRTSFFPTLLGTLDHILDVDLYYLGSLLGDPATRARVFAREPHATLAPLSAEQADTDERLVAFCDALTPASINAVAHMDRGERGTQRDLVGHVLAHLFQHQTHHRGQVHAMLSGTRVAPPQLDEFLMSSEAHLRRPEMAALGWREEDVWGAGDDVGPPGRN